MRIQLMLSFTFKKPTPVLIQSPQSQPTQTANRQDSSISFLTLYVS